MILAKAAAFAFAGSRSITRLRPESSGRGLSIWDPDRESKPFETGQIRNLLHLHADANHGLTRQRGGHDRSDSSMNDGKIGHLIDLQRREPSR